VPSSIWCCPWGSFESVVKMLLFMDVAKLFWRDGRFEWPTLDSPLLEALLSSGPMSAGKAQA
jgi:hypothetical protein